MSNAKSRKPRLGKGLSSLMSQPVEVSLPPYEAPDLPKPAAVVSLELGRLSAEGERLRYLPVDKIAPNPHQPRQRFEQGALEQLAASIRTEGVMQPIIVRPAPDGTYQLVAGERRWRAAQLAELPTIPAIVRELSDQQAAEWAIIENLQREDLNPIERAQAFRNLIDNHHLGHDQIAGRIGIDRSTIANLLRLLTLPADVRDWVAEQRLSMGQARAIAALTDPKAQSAVARKAIEQAWSVRRVEQAVRLLMESPATGKGGGRGATGASSGSHFKDLEHQVARSLGTKVHIKRGRRKGSGTLSIDFYSVEQFDTLLGRLGVTLE